MAITMTKRPAKVVCVDGRLDCSIHCHYCGTLDLLYEGVCRWCRTLPWFC